MNLQIDTDVIFKYQASTRGSFQIRIIHVLSMAKYITNCFELNGA